MERNNIAIENLDLDIFKIFNENWALLTCGDFKSGDFNTMTISWGTMGTLWFKNVVFVFVRPSRHTFQFMEKYDSFTLNTLPSTYKEKLSFCGANSGKNVDKISECEFTPIESSKISSPGFNESELIVECKKLYLGDMKPENFISPDIIKECYPTGNLHRMYVGEVIAASGISKYQS